MEAASAITGLIWVIVIIIFGIAWLILPFIVISKLNDVRRAILETNGLLKSTNIDLREINKNTGDTARFFNERDVKIQQ